jgi:hypothetical protein
MRHAAAAPRILDLAEPDRPEDVLLAEEARDAMLTALGELSGQERRDVLAYYSAAGHLGRRHPQAAGTQRRTAPAPPSTCETLSEPLDRRSIALTVIAIPGGLAAWAAGKAVAHPGRASR